MQHRLTNIRHMTPVATERTTMSIDRRRILSCAATLMGVALLSGFTRESYQLKAQEAPVRGWKQGQGWGWIWGKDDEVGALNAVNPTMVLKAVSLVKRGKVYDLGVTYDRTSFKWPGHSPGEVLSFRTPEGVKRQKDLEFTLPAANPAGLAWHSCALFINDNVATQIDGLGHITTGMDNHWYNGFKEADWGGNWGIRKTDVTTIPPMVLRAVVADVAGFKKVDALKSGTAITIDDLKKTLEWEGVDVRPGDAVFIRTGTLRYWGETGSDHEKLRAHDSAGIDLAAAKWLVEQKGAILVGSDTSGLEVTPAPAGSRCFNPVHEYLLVEQGVHIGEFHNLEELARDRAYEFCYIAATNKIKGTVAGFAMRPLALR
ncbi:MAG: cyclase family protein [Acidimicrobiia bacterium]|nr:cyclase family protein [Acidimicrobiia bacterium]